MTCAWRRGSARTAAQNSGSPAREVRHRCRLPEGDPRQRLRLGHTPPERRDGEVRDHPPHPCARMVVRADPVPVTMCRQERLLGQVLGTPARTGQRVRETDHGQILPHVEILECLRRQSTTGSDRSSTSLLLAGVATLAHLRSVDVTRAKGAQRLMIRGSNPGERRRRPPEEQAPVAGEPTDRGPQALPQACPSPALSSTPPSVTWRAPPVRVHDVDVLDEPAAPSEGRPDEHDLRPVRRPTRR